MDLKTKAKDQKISITMTSLQVEPMSRKERRCTDFENNKNKEGFQSLENWKKNHISVTK